jgi:sec-independent protein translocase protein TatB
MFRMAGNVLSVVRKLAGEFQDQFKEAMREAELDDVKKTVDDLKSLNPTNAIRDAVADISRPFQDAARDVKNDVDRTSNAVSTAASQQIDMPPPSVTLADGPPTIDPPVSPMVAEPAPTTATAANDAKRADGSAA